MARLHNALGITIAVPVQIGSFHSRPFQVLNSNFAEALRAQIQDDDVKRIANKRLIGNIDQFSDSTDLREATYYRAVLRKLYE